MAKEKSYICVHTIAESLEKDTSIVLRGFHAFSGCNTISFYSSKEKLSAWQAWCEFDEVTDAFPYISSPIPLIPRNIHTMLKKLIVCMYNKEDTCILINNQRKSLFVSSTRDIN